MPPTLEVGGAVIVVIIVIVPVVPHRCPRCSLSLSPLFPAVIGRPLVTWQWCHVVVAVLGVGCWVLVTWQWCRVVGVGVVSRTDTRYHAVSRGSQPWLACIRLAVVVKPKEPPENDNKIVS